MIIQYHTAHANKAFDQLIRRVETWLGDRVPAVGVYDSKTVRERLTQAIVAASRDAYNVLCSDRLSKGLELVPLDDHALRIGGLVTDPINGRVGLSFKTLAMSAARFTYHWFLLLCSILLGGLAGRKRDKRPVTILLGLGTKPLLFQESDERFVEFCKNGPIPPLAKATQLLIQTYDKKGSISDIDVIYTKDPISYMVRYSPIRMAGRLKLLAAHLWSPIKFSGMVLRMPLLSLLGDDLAYAPAVQALDVAGIIEAVLITNSSYTRQPLWMRCPAERRFRVHKIHYSQNSVGFRYRDDSMEAVHPAFRHVRVDEHWVWTPGYGEHLAKLGHQGPIHVVGPIMWYLPGPALPREKNEIRIAVFDVTPFYPDRAARMGLIRYYYKAENMLRFVNGIVDVCEEIESIWNREIRILLKHKRALTKGLQDEIYINGIQNLLETNSRFELVPFDVNLFSLLSSCDLSISIPYTSTAYFTCYQEKPAIYFDPTKELEPSHEPTPLLRFASGKSELKKAVRDVLDI